MPLMYIGEKGSQKLNRQTYGVRFYVRAILIAPKSYSVDA